MGGSLVTALVGLTAGGWTATVGFSAALGAELYTYFANPDRAWYEGRAAAESAKTLAWRYSVRGDAFEAALSQSEIDRHFLTRIRETLADLRDVDLASTLASEQITGGMRDARAADFSTRKRMYRDGRIESQRIWYSERAAANRRASEFWTVVLFGSEAAGLIGGGLAVAGVTVVGNVSVDLLGFFAAVAATATAWLQAKQHRALATAYGIAAQELAAVKSEVNLLDDEAAWADFVGHAEEAISREHTLWRASRGAGSARQAGT